MTYDTIRLEKGMYAQPGGLTAALEKLDPSSNYAGTELQGLDAFQRQLKRFDIKVGGISSDAVEKFFRTTESSALFPEYVSRAVHSGLEQTNHLPDIVATTTRIDGLDYRTITSVPSKERKSLKDVGEGAAIPQTSVTTQENLVRLHKRGRMLVASYEAIKYQRLDLFTVTLRQIGAAIARQQFQDAVEVLIDGDGNNNAAAKITLAETGKFSYADLLSLWNAFEEYELNTLVASSDMMLKLLKMEQFQNPLTGLNFQGTGKLASPLGAKLIRSSDVSAGTLVGLDKNCALEMVVASDIAVDYDRLIDRQLERAAVTATVGFAKIFADASKVLKV